VSPWQEFCIRLAESVLIKPAVSYAVDSARLAPTVSPCARLGLLMVYAFAQRHGGTLELATAPGKGAAFTLWFPASP
jgi:hypothetical protein